MYEQTKEVNSYYLGVIGEAADYVGTIYECRKRGFELLVKVQFRMLIDSRDNFQLCVRKRAINPTGA